MVQFFQKDLSLPPFPRGFHLITSTIEHALTEIQKLKYGLLHIFIRHTSASLCLNENTDPAVRNDLEAHFNKFVPEHAPYYQHTMEGPDDMPAHIKSALLGSSLTIPLTHGKMNLGTWQGIYLCEHRNQARSRHLIITAYGIQDYN